MLWFQTTLKSFYPPMFSFRTYQKAKAKHCRIETFLKQHWKIKKGQKHGKKPHMSLEVPQLTSTIG